MKRFKEACIIDDDVVFVIGTKRLMQIVGFSENIINFENGDEALIYLEPRIKQGYDLPDVIFLDLNMPIVDGWMFLDRITQIPVDKPINIYIVTSSISEDDINRAKLYSIVSNYIVKPITKDGLIEILQSVDNVI